MAAVLAGLFLAPSMAWALFTDVPETHEHFAAVQWMEGRGVVQGYDDGLFHPEWQVNRAEALKIVLLASDVKVEGAGSTEAGGDEVAPAGVEAAAALFPDVKPEQWFYPYVKKALELGIVSGYPDGTFRPAKIVNWAEMLKMVYLANGAEVPAVTRSPYPDVDAAAWFAAYVADAKAKNFVAAQRDGYFHPDWPVLRADLTEATYRFSYVKTFEKNAFPLGLNWPLVSVPGADVALKVPFGWRVSTGSNGELVAWFRDETFHQTGWGRTTPHSAVVSVLWDPNTEGLTTTAYFDRVREGLGAYGEIKQINTVAGDDTPALLLEYDGPYERMRDIVVEMPHGFVTVQATYGKGRLSEQWGLTVEAMHSTVQYFPETPAVPERRPEDAVAEARLAIQADGQGNAMLELFDDRELIETDTIGVGTGPVDYFYSAWADVTLKYERSFDVLLDVKEGRTTAF